MIILYHTRLQRVFFLTHVSSVCLAIGAIETTERVGLAKLRPQRRQLDVAQMLMSLQQKLLEGDIY